MKDRKVTGWKRTGSAMPSSAGHDLFVSHSSAQHEAAFQLVVALEQQGITSWIAPRDLVGGKSYMTQLQEAIRSAEAIVLLLTSEAIRSPHVRCEIKLAEKYNKKIIAMQLCDCDPGAILNPMHTGTAVYNFREIDWRKQIPPTAVTELLVIMKDTSTNLKIRIIREAKYSSVTRKRDIDLKEIFAEAKEGVRKSNAILWAHPNRNSNITNERPQASNESIESVFESLLLVHTQGIAEDVKPLADRLRHLGYAINYLVPMSTDRETAITMINHATHVVIICGCNVLDERPFLSLAELAMKKKLLGITLGAISTDLQYVFAGKHLLRAQQNELAQMADQIVFGFRYQEEAGGLDRSVRQPTLFEEYGIVSSGFLVALMVGFTYLISVFLRNFIGLSIDPWFWAIASFILYTYMVCSSKANMHFIEAEGKSFLPATERFERKHPVGCGCAFFLSLLLAWPLQVVPNWLGLTVSYWYSALFVWAVLVVLFVTLIYIAQRDKLKSLVAGGNSYREDESSEII